MTKSFLAHALLVLLTIGASSLYAVAPPDADSLLLDYTQSVLKEAGITGSEQSAFARALLKSKDWQHEIWDSGPVEDPAATLQSLYLIWKSDPAMTSHLVNRRMATALALEGPIGKWEQAIIIDRYNFYSSRFTDGLLNSDYTDLSIFERRYLARGVQHSHFNSITSMEYLNDEVCLPAEKYTSACWYPPYQLNNPFGDSIHGPLYYHPFQGAWGSAAEMVREVGGVCGSLSNFGAAAAIANGIPAVTMGEPGHCAYAVRVKPGEWVPSYSLSWKRGLHTSYYNETWGWHMLNTKAQDTRSAANASGDLRRLTQYHLNARNTNAALNAIRVARTRYPLYWSNWRLSIDALTQTNASAKEWQTLHHDVIKSLAPLSSEVAFHILDKHIYDKVLPNGDDAVHQRSNILLTYHWSFKDWGLGRWDFNSALQRQLKRLSGDAEIADKFMVDAFTIHAKENVFSRAILEEQLRIVGTDQTRRQHYIANISRNLTKDADSDAYKNMVQTIATKVLPYAASQGDRSTFQFIGKMASEFYPALDVSPDSFSGQLLSSGGIFSIMKPGNRYDTPSQHWGVIEPHGGRFHTNNTPAIATVQLGNYGRLSGVTIVTTNSHFQRMENAILEVSTDGEQWTKVHTFTKHQRVHRIDLKDQNIDAGYVRVVQPNHASIHFNKFHVYGKKQN